MGRKVPRWLVSASDALAHRAHEEHRPVTPPAPRTDPQLFPRSEAAFKRSCRVSEQQIMADLDYRAHLRSALKLSCTRSFGRHSERHRDEDFDLSWFSQETSGV